MGGSMPPRGDMDEAVFSIFKGGMLHNSHLSEILFDQLTYHYSFQY